MAVDASSGDKGISVNIDGALAAVRIAENLEIILVGREVEIREYLKNKPLPPQISICNANKIVAMSDSPLRAARDEENSIVKAIELHKHGEADAVMSIGNTGAVAASAMIRLKTIAGVERTPLLTAFSVLGGHKISLLDVGANVDCKPKHLVQFAAIGAAFSEKVLKIKNPRVALLSIGEEAEKGDALVRETHALLQNYAPQLHMNFIGNIEGRDILKAHADVIVCDGFVGNVLLKYSESFFSIVKMLFKKGRRYSILSLIGGLFLYPSIRRNMKHFSYDEYGGAPLLGVNGNVVIGHGSSNAKAVKNAILLAHHMANADLTQALTDVSEKLREMKYENGNSGDGFIRTGKNSH